tara:strand:- start:1109 stop:1438 length:330 start_codon:yes stop_codon:yes gene_type:complete
MKDLNFSKLLQIGNQAKKLREQMIEKDAKFSLMPLNYFIKLNYNLGNQKLNTFKKWKNQGFKVKKGEKGYLFFSAPKQVKVKTKAEEEATYSRFMKCYLFAESQVEKMA